ncbi:polymorphic toxin type 44 domain-containing protein [Pseudomonas sp. CCNWLW56]|uniref:polymorphic toxin type 44 domain-containing protein n=1 Tax=unclassified Pseudomonas TaxID=196821 RepID=UPI003FD02925
MDQPIHQERNAIINRYQLDKASLEKRVQAEQRGREYEEFGNFNYGTTGTVAGISEQILLRAAGAAQSIAGTSEE